MLRQESTNIDGHDVQVTVFPAIEGLSIKYKLLKIFSPALSGLISSLDLTKKVKLSDVDIDTKSIGEGIESLMAKMSDPSVIDLIIDTLKYAQFDGRVLNKININDCFSANYVLLYKVIGYVIEVNRFFGARSIGSLIEGLFQAEGAPLPTKKD